MNDVARRALVDDVSSDGAPSGRREDVVATMMSLCVETRTPISIVPPLVPVTMVLESKTKVQTLYMMRDDEQGDAIAR